MSFCLNVSQSKKRNEATFEGNKSLHIMADNIITTAATAEEHSPASFSQGL